MLRSSRLHSAAFLSASQRWLCNATAAAAAPQKAASEKPATTTTTAPPKKAAPASSEKKQTIALAEALITGGGRTVLEMGTSKSYKEDQRFIASELRRTSFANWSKVLTSLGCILVTMLYIPPYMKKFNGLVADRRAAAQPEFGPVEFSLDNWRRLVELNGGSEERARTTFWQQYANLEKISGKSDLAAPKSMFTHPDTAFSTGTLGPKKS
jgi:hypothetical protein